MSGEKLIDGDIEGMEVEWRTPEVKEYEKPKTASGRKILEWKGRAVSSWHSA
jgi:hypothetical protein